MTREFIRVSFSVSLCACIQNINTNPILFVINQRLMIMADKYVQLWFPLSMIYRSYVHNEKKGIYIYINIIIIISIMIIIIIITIIIINFIIITIMSSRLFNSEGEPRTLRHCMNPCSV